MRWLVNKYYCALSIPYLRMPLMRSLMHATAGGRANTFWPIYFFIDRRREPPSIIAIATTTTPTVVSGFFLLHNLRYIYFVLIGPMGQGIAVIISLIDINVSSKNSLWCRHPRKNRCSYTYTRIARSTRRSRLQSVLQKNDPGAA